MNPRAKQLMAIAHSFRRLALRNPAKRVEYMKSARLGVMLARAAQERNAEPMPNLPDRRVAS
jgi:hypothetical protein